MSPNWCKFSVACLFLRCHFCGFTGSNSLTSKTRLLPEALPNRVFNGQARSGILTDQWYGSRLNFEFPGMESSKNPSLIV